MGKMTKLCVSIIAAFACYSANASTSNGIAVSLNTAKPVLESHEDVVMNVKITNTSNSPQYVLKWFTPFGDVEESLFEVYRDGVKVNYVGAHYKRVAPSAGDYYLLKPGKSYNQKVELSALYDMSVTGNYTIRYRAESMNLFSGNDQSESRSAGPNEVGLMQSENLTMWINGRQSLAIADKQAPVTSLAGLSTLNCSASQTTSITSAVGAAKTYSNNALAYFNAGTKGSRLTTWFGVYNATRYATGKAHFSAIYSAFTTQAVSINCSCSKAGVYAYVYPTQPYKIWVCPAFWSAPMTGTDSKGGTLVHEMSHFNAVAATDDWVYGQSGAKKLAISDPAKAIDNADSHEYFAENTPALN